MCTSKNTGFVPVKIPASQAGDRRQGDGKQEMSITNYVFARNEAIRYSIENEVFCPLCILCVLCGKLRLGFSWRIKITNRNCANRLFFLLLQVVY